MIKSLAWNTVGVVCVLAGALSALSHVRAAEPAQAESQKELSWAQGDGFVALRQKDQVVWQFNYGPTEDKPCFHPVAIAGGPTLTQDRPEDHVWHRALWFSWKFINGVNYWEPDLKTMKMVGRTVVKDARIDTPPDFSARITMDIAYGLADQEPLLTEKRLVEVTPPDASGGYMLDWRMTFTAGSQKVVLDRTPLPGEPDGKVHGGYAGLSVRFAREMTEIQATNTEGPIEFEAGRYRGPSMGMDYCGRFDGKEAGIAILDHPRNLNSPSPWYVIHNAKMAYYSPAVIQQGPHTLEPGESMTLQYRVLVHAGRLSAEQLREAVKRYTGGK
ncbi:MAG: PmoA family protein [Planctomycetota bacterium]